MERKSDIELLKRSNVELKNSIKILKKHRRVFRIVLILIFLLWFFLCMGLTSLHGQTHPTIFNDLKFFVESNPPDTSFSLGNNHIAFCESIFCLTHPNTENAIITEQYCDVSNSCGEGCVRRWLDQSDYVAPNTFNPPEYNNGRNFGQDDNEKPCYISNCINGKPCVRGGAPYGTFTQDKYLELQISDFINLTNDFSIFMLVKPIDQSNTGDWFYFGQSSHFLRHNVSNNSLKIRVPGNFQTTISTNNAIMLDTWQLIEVHRSNSGFITVFVDGVDKTLNDSIVLNGNFQIGYLFSNFKTTGQANQTAMYGDVAAFLVYNRDLNELEKIEVRSYFNMNYLDETLSISNNEWNDFSLKMNKESLKIYNGNSNYIESLIIYDILGKEILQTYINSSDINIIQQVPEVVKGVYAVHIISNNKRIIRKIVNN